MLDHPMTVVSHLTANSSVVMRMLFEPAEEIEQQGAIAGVEAVIATRLDPRGIEALHVWRDAAVDYIRTAKAYDADGYDKSGYDRSGHDRDGYDRAGYDRQGYNRHGHDRAGFDRRDIHRDTSTPYDRAGFDRDGYAKDGYNRHGYDRDGFSRNGVGGDGYDREGYDRWGRDRDNRDRDGYDRDGFDRDGYAKDGFDRAGFNRRGRDRDGKALPSCKVCGDEISSDRVAELLKSGSPDARTNATHAVCTWFRKKREGIEKHAAAAGFRVVRPAEIRQRAALFKRGQVIGRGDDRILVVDVKHRGWGMPSVIRGVVVVPTAEVA